MGKIREQSEAAAALLLRRFSAWKAPVAMVQLGRGFDPTALFDEELQAMPLAELPGLAAAAAAGMEGELRLGCCGSYQVLLVTGCHSFYEGHGAGVCVLPACAAARAGIANFLLLDAARSIRDDFKPGTWVMLTDCINNLGTSPLVGNLDLGEDAFPDMNGAFSQALNAEVANAAAATGLTLRLGVAQVNLGPQFDSPAEVEAARRSGADLTGTGVILETVALRALRRRVAGLLLVTHLAASHAARPPRYQEILEACRYCSTQMMRGLRACLRDGLRIETPA